MEWTIEGLSVLVGEVALETICNKKKVHRLAVPLGATQPTALQTCNKLGHSHMTSVNSEEEMEDFILWFRETSKEDICKYIWTPFSDAETEGVFVSLVDHSNATYLPWMLTQPNGGLVQSAVTIDTRGGPGHYVADVGADYLGCFSCSSPRRFSLKRMGACLHSHLGWYFKKSLLHDTGERCEVFGC